MLFIKQIRGKKNEKENYVRIAQRSSGGGNAFIDRLLK